MNGFATLMVACSLHHCGVGSLITAGLLVPPDTGWCRAGLSFLIAPAALAAALAVLA